MIRNISLIAMLGLLLTSCDVLLKTAETIMDSEKPLTTYDVSMGLKEALAVGTDSAGWTLNKINGYYHNELLKIGLPPQTNEIITHARKVPGLDKLIEDLILQINRSAEDAARQAAPVFKQAITQMTIADAWAILNGDDYAATEYLKAQTGTELALLYKPVMQQSLNKSIAGNVSAQKSWDEVVSRWNVFANSIAGRVAGVNAVDVALDDYVTQKALDGMFFKVAEQEKNIRNNANARVSDLLQRVFKRQN